MTQVRSRSRALLALLVALVASVVVMPTGPAGADEPAFPVRDTYAEAGPYAVSHEDATDGTWEFTIHRPTTLSDSSPHPILTWGNGISSSCDVAVNAAVMDHLASWGYVVICAKSGMVGATFYGWSGDGDRVLAAARYLVSANDAPDSPYYQRLDPTRVGALGSSQGACAAVWATIKSDGLITSTISHAFVDPFYAFFACPYPEPDWNQLTDPVLFVRGTNDNILGFPLATGAETTRKYDAVGGAPAAKAELVDGCHCLETAYYAYLTAWFEYTLGGDPQARAAFVEVDGRAPEIARDPAWANVATKRLP